VFYLYITSLPHKRQLYQVAQWQESVLQVDGSAIDPDSRPFFFLFPVSVSLKWKFYLGICVFNTLKHQNTTFST